MVNTANQAGGQFSGSPVCFGDNMYAMEERRPFHRWRNVSDVYCDDCGCYDAVHYCSQNHPEDCHCTNPPCPATDEERLAVANKCLGTPHFWRADPEEYRVDTTTTTITATAAYPPIFTVGLSEALRFSISSPEATVHARDTPKVTYVGHERDVGGMMVLYHMLCSEHGRFSLKVSYTSAMLNTQQVQEEVWKTITRCPTCLRAKKEGAT